MDLSSANLLSIFLTALLVVVIGVMIWNIAKFIWRYKIPVLIVVALLVFLSLTRGHGYGW